MAQFYFDIHSQDLSQWDKDGQDCRGDEAIAQHALRLLRVADDAGRVQGPHDFAVVSVRDAGNQPVLTATRTKAAAACLRWASPRVPCAVPPAPLLPRTSGLMA